MLIPEELQVRQELYKLLREKIRRKLYIQLFRKQEEVKFCDERRIILRVGRRGGKTDFLCYDICDNLLNRKEANLLYLAKSGESAKGIVWPKLMRIMGEKKAIKINEHALEITNLGNKARLKLGGADKEPDTWRGQAYHAVYVDEAAFIRDLKYLVTEVLEPALMDYEGRLFLASSPYGYNDFYQFSVTKGWKEFYWTAYDNPFIKKKEMDRIKEQYGERSMIWQQEYLGLYVRHDGLIFKNFRVYPPFVVPTIKDLSKTFRKILIIDPGATAPTGIVLLAHDPIKDKLYVLKAQNKRTGGDITPIARLIQEERLKHENLTIICDGAAAHVIAELQKRHAIPVISWTKKDVVGSYNRLITRLERGGLILFKETTEDLQVEMLEAEWKPTRDPNDESGKVIGSDHCLDALRYGNEFIYFREKERDNVKIENIDENEKKVIERLLRQREEEEYGID